MKCNICSRWFDCNACCHNGSFKPSVTKMIIKKIKEIIIDKLKLA